jgi:hypothetical protein
MDLAVVLSALGSALIGAVSALLVQFFTNKQQIDLERQRYENALKLERERGNQALGVEREKSFQALQVEREKTSIAAPTSSDVVYPVQMERRREIRHAIAVFFQNMASAHVTMLYLLRNVIYHQAVISEDMISKYEFDMQIMQKDIAASWLFAIGIIDNQAVSPSMGETVHLFRQLHEDILIAIRDLPSGLRYNSSTEDEIDHKKRIEPLFDRVLEMEKYILQQEKDILKSIQQIQHW